MNKLKAFFTLFRYGEEVIDPTKWKARQIDINILVPIISAALILFGVEVDAQDILNVAIGIISISNIVFTIITSKKIGL